MRLSTAGLRVRSWAFALVLIGAGSPSWATEPSPRDASDVDAEIAQSRTLYREAQSAFEAGEHRLAQKKLLEAWAIRKTFDVTSALAQAALELGQYRNAAEYAEYCLRVFAPAESDETLQIVHEMYADAKKHIGTIRIQAKPDGATLVVDGKPVGTSPLEVPVFLDPGPHQIQMRLRDVTSSQLVNVEAGKEYAIQLGLQPAPLSASSASSASSAVSPLGPTPKPLRSRERHQYRDFEPVYWTLALGGTVTAVGLLTGVLYRARALSKQDSANALKARVPSCSNLISPECSELATLASERNTANTSAIVILGVTGAAALATGVLTYVVWPASNPKDSVQPSAWAGPHAAGFGLVGRFQ